MSTQPSPLFVWFLAMRPWSFTASIIPVSLGAGIAWLQGQFHPGLFLLTLLGAVALQAGTNFFNTFGDYVAKVDSIASAVLDGISAEMQASGVDIGGAEDLAPEELPEVLPEILPEAPVEAAAETQPQA